MSAELEFLTTQLLELKSVRSQLPLRFAEAQKQVDKHIDDLCRKAGITEDIQKAREELSKLRDSLQRQVDELTGKINAYEIILDKFHRVPVEPGTIKHGIDISKLDWQTRLMVINDNVQTIEALGGKFEPSKEVIEVQASVTPTE